MPEDGSVHAGSQGGIAASHASIPALRVLAAPTTEGAPNTIRASIIPLACFKMEDIRFDFGSSVLLPEIKEEMPLLASLIGEHTDPPSEPDKPLPKDAVRPPMSIFGHADPVGDDDLNKSLSGRRAAAVYGMLTRKDKVWEDLYSDGGEFARPAAGDKWGIRSLQIMLNEVSGDDPAKDSDDQDSQDRDKKDADGFPIELDPTSDLDGDPTDPPDPKNKPKLVSPPLDVNNQLDQPTKEAVKRFQGSPRGKAAGLTVDGNPDQKTRSALFLAYMDAVCIDEEGEPFKIDPMDGFLGQGSDAAGKADFQGCGEFNPLLVFSKEEKAAFDAAKDKSARNLANAPNRRVLVLLFRPGVQKPQSWPCPRAKEGVSACKARFWSDGEKRRTPTTERREFADTLDTFACRFYQRMTTGSPCERAVSEERVALRIQIHDAFYQPVKNEAFTATGEGGFFERGTSDDDGFITIRAPKGLASVVVRYTPQDLGHEYAVRAALVPPEKTDDPSLIARLQNIGFGRAGGEGDSVLRFQAAHGKLDLTATLDGPTKDAANKVLNGELRPDLGVNSG